MRAPWLFRTAWLILPFTLGPILATALDDTSTPGRRVVSVALWSVWATTLVGALVPRTVTLTLVRIVGPATLAAAIWATAAAGFDAAAAMGLIGASIVTVLVSDPALAEHFVNGSSYGPEIRLPLRTPAAVILGPLPLAWSAVVIGAGAGPMLLAYQRWLPGIVLSVIGVPLAGMAARSLHGLSRRWLILVPGGVVVHDPLALREPVLMPSPTVMDMRPAPAEFGPRLDLTGRAPGLAVQIDLDPAVGFGLIGRDRRTDVTEATAVLVTPDRANRALSLGREKLRLR